MLLALSMIPFALSNLSASDSKVFIIFQYYAGFRTDWSEIKKDISENLVLVRFNHSGKELTDREKSDFDAVHVVDDFEKSTLVDVIKPYVDLFGEDQVRIVTNDEWALLPAAKMRESLGIPGDALETIEKFRNKVRMKEVVFEAGLEVPKYCVFYPEEYRANPETYSAKVIDYLKLPVFVKPIDGASSYGVAKITSKEDLKSWMEKNLDSSMTYEIDEFIEGRLYHCDCLVKDNEIVFFSIGKQDQPCFNFFQGTPIATRMLDPTEPEYQRLKDYNKRVFEALSTVPNGATHLELFVTDDNRYVFLEIAARVPGGYIPECYSKMFDFPFEEASFRLQMEKPTAINTKIKNYVAYFYFPKTQGRVIKRQVPPIHSEYDCDFFVELGDEITQDPSLVINVASKMLIWNKDKEALFQDFHHLIQNMPVTIQKIDEPLNAYETITR